MSCDCDDCTGENAKRKLRQQLALVSKQNADNLKMRGEYMKERDDARSKLETVKADLEYQIADKDMILDQKKALEADVEAARELWKSARKRADDAELQVDALRRWIRLYSECDCDVSRNKGMVHWFACRFVLGRKALGEAVNTTREADSSFPKDRCPIRIERDGLGCAKPLPCPDHTDTKKRLGSCAVLVGEGVDRKPCGYNLPCFVKGH